MPIKRYSQFNTINETFNIKVGQYSEFEEESEVNSAKSFEWVPEASKVKVVEVNGDITDDYNTTIDIKLSNGDEIHYEVNERRMGGAGETEDKLVINGQQVESNLEWLGEYTDGTITGAILNYYSNWKNNNK